MKCVLSILSFEIFHFYI